MRSCGPPWKKPTPNYSFFWDTVPTAENEYDARANSVAWGRDVDPSARMTFRWMCRRMYSATRWWWAEPRAITYTYRLLDANTPDGGPEGRLFKAVESGGCAGR